MKKTQTLKIFYSNAATAVRSAEKRIYQRLLATSFDSHSHVNTKSGTSFDIQELTVSLSLF